MGNIPLRTLKLYGLDDTYTVPPEGSVSNIIDVTTEDDINNALTAEMATMTGNTVRFLVFSPKVYELLYGAGTLCELYYRGTGYGTARFIQYDSSGVPTILYKNMYNGVWSPFEWENPPMTIGVEYRTTERYNGKPVYIKAFSYGDLSATPGRVEVGIGTSGVIDIVSIEGILRANPFNQYDFSQPLPLFSTDSFSAATPSAFVFLNYGVGSPSVILQSSIDLSNYICTVTVRYTKS